MIIAVDFDCCIAHYKKWKGIDVFGGLIVGAKEALIELKNQGHRIIIYTCRKPTLKLQNYLKINGIPFDAINENPWTWLEDNNPNIKRKISADIYIDDKALTFKGDWNKTLEEVLNFKSWQVKNDLIEKNSEKAKNFIINNQHKKEE